MSCGHNLIGTVVGIVAVFNQRGDISNITAQLFSTAGNYSDSKKTISLQPSSHAVPGSIAVRDHAYPTVDGSGIGASEAGTLEADYNGFTWETFPLPPTANITVVA